MSFYINPKVRIKRSADQQEMMQKLMSGNKVFDEFRNTKEDYYRIRALDWRALPAHVAAARMIFLNKTCFNGLCMSFSLFLLDSKAGS